MLVKNSKYLSKKYSYFFKNKDLMFFLLLDLNDFSLKNQIPLTLIDTNLIKVFLSNSIYLYFINIFKLFRVIFIIETLNQSINSLIISNYSNLLFIIKFENKIYLSSQLKYIKSTCYHFNLKLLLVNLKLETYKLSQILS